MRKGIWEQFDGYDDILAEIEASRSAAAKRSLPLDGLDPIINRLHPQRQVLEVADIIRETADAATLRLIPAGGTLPPFLAGQYLALYLEVDGISTSRPYSISSPPNRIDHYDITVKRVPQGLVSNYLLDRIHKGDRLTASGPQGNFYFNPLVHGETMICIAGGSGITPFMSMIREIIERGLQRRVMLYYGNRSSEDIIFHASLSRMTDHLERFRYIPVIENASGDYAGQCGLITADLIRETADNLDTATFFVCGPQGLYDFCLPQIDRLGIPRRRIRRELYGPPADIRQDPAWPPAVAAEHQFSVSVTGGPTFSAPAATPLLVSLEKNGVVPPSVCRSGECSMCRVKLLAGKVFQPAGTPVRKSDRRYGYIHACVSYPLTDLAIQL